MTHRIYSRAPKARRFKPMDMEQGVQVSNLLHATLYEQHKPTLDLWCKDLEKEHPGWAFEARRVA